MSVSRRNFLKAGSTVLAASTLPFGRARAADLNARQEAAWSDYVPDRANPALFPLLTRAIEAARAAGATYADARYLSDSTELWPWGPKPNGPPYTQIECGFGIRALYNGYWGYAASTGRVMLPDRAAALGREAAAQAKTGAKGPSRVVELAPAPVVQNGVWTTPIEIDPFAVAWDEKRDVINGLLRYYANQPFGAGSEPYLWLTRNEQSFVSTEGSSYSQTLYKTGLNFNIGVGAHWRTHKPGGRLSDRVVTAAGAGWEYILNAPLEIEAARSISQARDATQPIPIDVGRYDVVFDGAALAKYAAMHLGPATELDRAMGYLANSTGTSYLNEPLEMVGSHVIGSPLVNVTANRSMRGGLATVQWDGEGVAPDDAVLVKDGILTDFQTTRESASWLAPYYQKTGKPVRSHGGMLMQYVRAVPAQAAQNLVVAPGKEETSFDALCSGVKKGLAVLSASGQTDQQALNAESSGDIVYEITNGKLGRVIEGGIVLTRSPEFWKNVIGLGGPGTVCAVGLMSHSRGWGQESRHTVSAPAALVKQVAVTVNQVRAE
jgi:TldD protein